MIGRQEKKVVGLFELANKNALITGGAQGIGRACAEILAKAGANITIADIDPILGQQTADYLATLGIKSQFIACDISDETQVEAMIAAVVQRFGRLDIAVNNAGFGMPGGQDENFPKADWDRLLDVNLTGTWLCARAEARQMMAQTPSGGKIINIASMCAGISIPGSSGAYDAAKAGVVHLTRSLAVQWGQHNINLNCISPSHVMTATMVNWSLAQRQRLRDITPMGHFQRPEDLQGPVLFFASSASDFITGQNLVVDGGHTLSTWLTPLERKVPARISPDQETVAMKQDLDALGIDYSEAGLRQPPQ